MTQTLQISDKHEHVECPACGYKWWLEVVYGGWDKTTHCPGCRAPLKTPTIDLTPELSSKEKDNV